ncbi:hypothetical protein R4Z10_19460 [Niallia sp. XMNu-256]|uniref:hypothetical protein n=1 Tax=Niallia sp. XMNu-256 TaxID=3082444 RepID=UPI0030CEEEDD
MEKKAVLDEFFNSNLRDSAWKMVKTEGYKLENRVGQVFSYVTKQEDTKWMWAGITPHDP